MPAITFKEFISEESATSKAKELISSGKYDPSVRGSGASFSRDLIASGVTGSKTTATLLWGKHKHLHPSSQKAEPKASSEKEHPMVTKAKKIVDLARQHGFHNAKVKVDKTNHADATAALGRDYDEHPNWSKLEKHIHKHNAWDVVAADVSGSNIQTVH